MKAIAIFVFSLILLIGVPTHNPAAAQDSGSIVSETDYSAFALRNIGPAFTSGRIADIAIDPTNDSVWYVAVGSGGVWKTENAGTTWNSIFDDQGSYSIGCITLDPSNPHTVWVGTGENVGGRHVGYGDGIYRSDDGGNSWKNMGLADSEHISKITVHPENSDIVWVAAQGPLWRPGGDRGFYISTNGGETWTKTLGDDEWVGVTDIILDPDNADVLYAATWQRHRNVAAYMGGGPGSGIHKSTDGGQTWTETKKGIPDSNLGKIGLAISPFNSDHIYAVIELDRKTGGLFMSTDRGGSWSKMSNAVSGGTGPHYYQELYASPHSEGRLYLMDPTTQISEDHGRTFSRLNESGKHGDNHALNFRTDDPNYLLMGSDGGIFESYDNAKTWRFLENLPLTQYYKVAVDDALPFYNIFGGTQDNGSHGGPSRTDNRHGIRSADWFKTLGSDGHQSAVEPGNSNIIYAETQQGGLHRIDRVTGEQVYIQPQAGEGEGYERFNWDAPIVISPHDPATLYFASYRVWKSGDRGDSWTAISGDLTRDQERFELPIMGRVQSWDNAWDLGAMSTYNTISSLAESPVQAGLLYAGTDDGIIQVSENDGDSWRKIEVGSIRGVPETAFVNNLYADLHDANVVYAALDNHKYGDLSPYLIKSSNKGASWESIVNNLPDRMLVWRIVQDHVNPNLLFVATELGIYFTVDGGNEWVKIAGGSPTISFRGITIQRRENDLVAASFGRGFFVLDDYSPLRSVSEEFLEQDAFLFPAKDALLYQPRDVAGGAQGGSYFTAPNPPFGATFTYYLQEGSADLKSDRNEAEKAAGNADIPFPGWDALEDERNEVPVQVEIVVRDAAGDVVNRVTGGTSKGFHRITWNLRFTSNREIEPGQPSGSNGYLATPGSYSATLSRTSDGVMTDIAGPIDFQVVPLYQPTLAGASPNEILAFQEEIDGVLLRASTFSSSVQEQLDKVDAMQTALDRADRPSSELNQRLFEAREALLDFQQRVSGYRSKGEVGERNDPSPQSRFSVGSRGLSTTYGPTALHRQAVETGKSELTAFEAELEAFIRSTMTALESAIQTVGAPPIKLR